MSKVAFIGLGVMGYPMAGHIRSKGGHDVTVYNRTLGKAQAWVAEFGGQLALRLVAVKKPPQAAEAARRAAPVAATLGHASASNHATTFACGFAPGEEKASPQSPRTTAPPPGIPENDSLILAPMGSRPGASGMTEGSGWHKHSSRTNATPKRHS